MNAIYYAGIGSRETPEHILQRMKTIGAVLARHKAILRSGGASGADTAFEQGCDHNLGFKQIFIPWTGFNGRKNGIVPFIGEPELEKQAMDIAERFHPAWHHCPRGARLLHTRNVAQILGPDLNTLTKFVVCWTKNGTGGGGTGQALRIAHYYEIPIFDLGKGEDEFNLLCDYCEAIFMPEITE